jgi:hypothetical protein
VNPAGTCNALWVIEIPQGFADPPRDIGKHMDFPEILNMWALSDPLFVDKS